MMIAPFFSEVPSDIGDASVWRADQGYRVDGVQRHREEMPRSMCPTPIVTASKLAHMLRRTINQLLCYTARWRWVRSDVSAGLRCQS